MREPVVESWSERTCFLKNFESHHCVELYSLFSFDINLISNPKWIVLPMHAVGILNMAKIWHTKYCQKSWQTFWKTVIFGNFCQIWHHLATVRRRGRKLNKRSGEHHVTPNRRE